MYRSCSVFTYWLYFDAYCVSFWFGPLITPLILFFVFRVIFFVSPSIRYGDCLVQLCKLWFNIVNYILLIFYILRTRTGNYKVGFSQKKNNIAIHSYQVCFVSSLSSWHAGFLFTFLNYRPHPSVDLTHDRHS